jgi:hypothetical protein
MNLNQDKRRVESHRERDLLPALSDPYKSHSKMQFKFVAGKQYNEGHERR